MINYRSACCRMHPNWPVMGPDRGNLIVGGDQLLELKALLPQYGAQVQCVTVVEPP